MRSALDVHRALLAAGVAHEVVRTSSPAASADELPEALRLDRRACVAVRCYWAGGGGRLHEELVAVAVQALETPDPAALLEALGADAVRPATADEVSRRTEYAAALVSPLALPDDVPLLADAALGERDVLYVPVGEAGLAVGIRTVDLLVASRARVASLTARPLAAEERPGWAGGTPLAEVIELPRPLRVG